MNPALLACLVVGACAGGSAPGGPTPAPAPEPAGATGGRDTGEDTGEVPAAGPGAGLDRAPQPAPGRTKAALADLPAWPATMDRVIERYGDARVVVPGHGRAGDASLLAHTTALAEKAME